MFPPLAKGGAGGVGAGHQTPYSREFAFTTS